MDTNQNITGRSIFDNYASPLYIMSKPAGAACNLDCSYCYYTEKANLYRGDGAKMMSDDTLELFTRKYLEAQTMHEVLFTWHGGEPLLRPISFYEKALRYQEYYAQGRHIDNCIQTNGTLITDEWCKFFKDHHWLVGLSVDGPEAHHDLYRKDHKGKATHSQVMQAIELLNRHGVEWNAMAVVNNINADSPYEFYKFFKDIDCRYIQFSPVVERIHLRSDGRHLAAPHDSSGFAMSPHSVTPEQWGEFLCRLFDMWRKTDVGTYFIQLFDATLANWAGVAPGICSLDRYCGHAGVMEYNGDVYSCDHFVFPEYKLGNIHTSTLVEMMYGHKQTEFGLRKTAMLPQKCKDCRYLFACNGECPKNRFADGADGAPHLNYLCSGYYRFFEHSAPYMQYMLGELKAGRAPANVMNVK